MTRRYVAMPRRRSSSQGTNPLGPSAVVGLEGGRELARRRQRRRHLRDKSIGAAGAIIAVAVVASVAYVGYTIYDEQQASERIETEQRQAELARQRSGEGLRDVIDDLEESPVWNGPGNPTFGVGERIEVVAPDTDGGVDDGSGG